MWPLKCHNRDPVHPGDFIPICSSDPGISFPSRLTVVARVCFPSNIKSNKPVSQKLLINYSELSQVICEWGLRVI